MRPSRGSRLLLAALVGGSLLAGLSTVTACDATGSTSGGEALLGDPCTSATLGHRWQDLYGCYFGPSGKASCTAQGFCHGASQQTGALSSGFVCGATRESCWQGITQGLPACDAGASASGDGGFASEGGGTDAAPTESGAGTNADAGALVDAGGAADSGTGAEADAASPAPACIPPPAPLVQSGSASDPTSTMLWHSLRGAPGVGLHNMPYSASAGGVTFTQADLDRISAWIREGAQDN